MYASPCRCIDVASPTYLPTYLPTGGLGPVQEVQLATRGKLGAGYVDGLREVQGGAEDDGLPGRLAGR